MKDKTTAALLALFLGWFGIHRFYLKQPGLGVLYIFFMFVGVSFILGIIDAIVLMAMDPQEFDRRYNDEYPHERDRYHRRSTQRDYRRSQRPVRRQQRQARRTTVPAPRRRQMPGNIQVPERRRVNPYKQSGIKKYKDFELEGAIEDFVKGLEISSRDIALHFNIACAYSLTEQVDKAYYHIDKAVEYGFSDFDKIKSHDDLAYVRIQPQFDDFMENGFRLKKGSAAPRPEPKQEVQQNTQQNKPQEIEPPKDDLLQDDVLLSQLKRLAELRDKGLITEGEFDAEKQKLMR